MTKGEYKRAIATGEVQLSFREHVEHFDVIYILLFFDVLLGMYAAGLLFSNDQHKLGVILFFMVFSTIIGLLYWRQNSRLKLKSISTTLSKEEQRTIVERLGEEQKWLPYYLGDNAFKARAHDVYSASSGEQVTVLFGKNKIYINSMCDLHFKASWISWGRNRKHMRLLLNRITEASLQKQENQAPILDKITLST
ncbi:hypothetical protein [Chitinophaga arvensicola]|uniref:Uncharacterized protein n=1 Tax=Chitinophaga arvensicola TaxID=29529 RepID=A0A1I0Q4Q8_9BACT|nr:hypothetical protein [Chitinophaga arvensicola]SEW21882.1 hypothetical protein SAMN04488122_1221 [Chitinophaga arvensicola]